MLLFQVAMVIFFVMLTLFMATKLFSVFFLLFSFRFWQMAFSYQEVSHMFGFEDAKYYYLFILFLSLLTWGLVAALNQKVQYSNLLILLIFMIIVLTKHSFADVFFFKDILQENEMWGIHFWIQQVKEAFLIGPDKAEKVMTEFAHWFIDFFRSIFSALNDK